MDRSMRARQARGRALAKAARQAKGRPRSSCYIQERRWRSLLKATDHVAPYLRNSQLQNRDYRAALMVVRTYGHGLDVRLLDRGTLLKAAGRSA